jgi:ArsR family transcriptional regulator
MEADFLSAQHETTCAEHNVHKEIVGKVKRLMKPEDTFFQLSEIFKVLGDPTRIKLLYALSIDELCVCDISNLLGMTESAISHQLRVLRNTRLVKLRREGRMVYYSLNDDHVRDLFKKGLEHVEE